MALLLIVIFSAHAWAEPAAPQNTFTVNDTDDAGDSLAIDNLCLTAAGTCTLRAAIEQINAFSFSSGPHRINFNIPGAGPHRIRVNSELPRLERAVIIDGSTEPGSSCPTSLSPATINIVIDGSNVSTLFSDGLNLWRNASAPSGSTIRGIAIGGFGYGIWLDGDGHKVECSHIGIDADGITPLSNEEAGINIWNGSGITIGGSSFSDRNVISFNNGAFAPGIIATDGAVIMGNYIGTDATGMLDAGNVRGISVGSGVTVGGTGSAEGNLISGNVDGILVAGDDVEIINNLIGTNATGTAAIPNIGNGIEVGSGVDNLRIGGGLSSEGNLISGNGSHGIYLGDTDGATILNNKIGTTLNGVGNLGNGRYGIFLDGNVDNTFIGTPTAGNTIAFNEAGIFHYYGSGYQGFSTHGNSFRGNSIHSNEGLGIDLDDPATSGANVNDGAGDSDDGPNDLQNYPGLFLARNNGYVLGLLATRGNIEYTIDFYENDVCDDSGYGEGKRYLDTIYGTTDNAGYYTIDTTLSNPPALGKYLVATATASDETTSEFSNCIPVTQATFVIDATGNSGDENPGDGLCDIAGPSDACTLLAAIEEVNALGGGPYGINFDLGPGGGTIRPTSPLPDISVPVVIDAVSQQDGASCGSESGPASLNVTLKGDLAGSGNGLVLDTGSDGSSIQGLVITDFPSHGIRVYSNDNQIICNFIGVASDGVTAAPNGFDGVHVTGSNNRIGGGSYELRNVLSGNSGSGAEIAGAAATGNKIKGNIIGLRAAGGLAVPNGEHGVDIDGAVDNVIGGNTTLEGNIISGNSQFGVSLHNGARENAVRGNRIGTNEAGTVDRGNTNAGVKLDNAHDNLIGGIDASYGNLISGNSGHGVLVQNGSSGNNIRHNKIGVTIDGKILSNDGAGVRFNVSSDNWVGDNTIKYNGEGGVVVMPSGQRNRIRSNDIYRNSGLGIDLGNDGVTANDGLGDADTGGNDLQNFPLIDSIDATAGTVEGRLRSTPNTEFRIDFFRSQQCDSSGYGEGQQYLDTFSGTSNGAGLLTFSQALTGLNNGVFVTATATDASQNTSEFSACVEVTDGCPNPDVDGDNDVDVADLIAVAELWGDAGLYDAGYDLNCDGVIDIADVILVTAKG